MTVRDAASASTAPSGTAPRRVPGSHKYGSLHPVKTTLEIPDPLFRRAKAFAAQQGISLKDLVNDAIARRLESAARPPVKPAWKDVFGELRSLRSETARVMARIDADSEQIDEDE